MQMMENLEIVVTAAQHWNVLSATITHLNRVKMAHFVFSIFYHHFLCHFLKIPSSKQVAQLQVPAPLQRVSGRTNSSGACGKLREGPEQGRTQPIYHGWSTAALRCAERQGLRRTQATRCSRRWLTAA